MRVETFGRGDVPVFLKLAASEGWVAEEWEFEFLLTVFPQGCFCLRDDSGEPIAFVTSITHGHSGWIGNLIVAEQDRGRGIGQLLFRNALSMLQDAGAETIWLTASKSGRALYERHGFNRVDTVVRWTASGRKRHASHATHIGIADSSATACAIDCLAWGDRRDGLLGVVTGRGRLLQEESGFLVVQPCDGAVQFGPFAAMDSSTADRIFNEAIGSVPIGTRVYVDAPASNRAAVRLFNRKSMRVNGSTELMYAGVKPDYRPEMLYGLATMGSCG
jgi:GNAT superfamily N-acetyltransferase